MSFEHMEPYTPLSPAELELLQDRGARQYAEADEDRAEADERREREDEHAEQACPRARRRIHQERAARDALYPRGDVAASRTRGEA